MNETTTRHPILDMLALGPEWEAQTYEAAACPACKREFEILVLFRDSVGVQTVFMTAGEYCLGIHSTKVGNQKYDEGDRSLLGIERVEFIGSEPCTRGRHEFWTWRKVAR